MKYRREIDGLRALAVVPVVLFHAGFESFSGGFVGVDVFFVISGYLITSIIVHDLQSRTFTVLGFYERRARRILPAMFAVMLVCLPFAWLWMLPQELGDFSKSLSAVSVFASNILFWLDTGYFDSDTAVKPLLHTWSLAVEEQYYLLFPIFLLFTWRMARGWVIATVAVVAIVSLLIAHWGSTHDPSAAFYLLPTRAWELLLGALIALRAAHPDRGGTGLSMPRSALQEVSGAAGLVLIGYSIFAFGPGTPFPGVYALVPTIGTALILRFSNERTFVGRALGNRLLVGVGLISYSVYLWHQPLFAFARLRSFSVPGKSVLLILSLASVALGFLSWKFIETPFRDRKRFSRQRIFRFAIGGGVAFFIIGIAGTMNRGFPARAAGLDQIAAVKTVLDSPCHTIDRRTSEQIAAGDICTLGEAPTPSFAVIGDSHAGALFEGIRAYRADSAFSFYAISGGFCAPLMNGFTWTGPQQEDCAATMREAFTKILHSDNITAVVLVAEWANYVTGVRDEADGSTPPAVLMADDSGIATSVADNRRVFERSLQATVRALTDAGKKVILVETVPEFHASVIPTISRHVLFGAPIGSIDSFAPVISLQDYRSRNAGVREVLARLPDVTIADARSVFCDNEICHSLSDDGKILFSDTNHVTEEGAKLLAVPVMEQLGM